jgi:hypothetical protein
MGTVISRNRPKKIRIHLAVSRVRFHLLRFNSSGNFCDGGAIRQEELPTEPAFALVVYLSLIGEPGGEFTHLRRQPQRDRPIPAWPHRKQQGAAGYRLVSLG